MKLTDRIVLAALSKRFGIQEVKRMGTCSGLEGAMLFESGEKVSSGWIYVVAPEDAGELAVMRHLPEDILLIYLGQPEAANEKDAMIVLEGARSVGAVVNELAKIYAAYAAWEYELNQIRMRFGNAEEMLRCSRHIFENPLAILRSDLSVLTSVSEQPLAGQYRFFSNGGSRLEMVRSILQDSEFRANQLKEEAYWGPDYLLGFRTIHRNIRNGGETNYLLTLVEAKRALSPTDLDLLDILGRYVRTVLQPVKTQGKRRDDNLHKILLRILSDRSLDYMEGSRSLAELGWMEGHDYMCLIYQLTYLDRQALPASTVCSYMEEQFPCCCSFPYKEDIVTFFDLSLSERSVDDMKGQLKTFIRDSYLKAGYSRVMSGHMNLRRQYVQSELALDVGSRQNPYFWIHHFDQVAMPYILEQITRRLPGDMLCHPGLIELKKMDREHGTEYMKTLRCYLDNEMNAVQSAKTLYIHRSTFLYRMEKIREVLGSDLMDPDEILYLMLSFRLLEHAQASPRL